MVAVTNLVAAHYPHIFQVLRARYMSGYSHGGSGVDWVNGPVVRVVRIVAGGFAIARTADGRIRVDGAQVPDGNTKPANRGRSGLDPSRT